MVVQYGVAAAEVAGESIGARFLGLSQLVSDSIQSIRVNRDEARSLAHRIHQLIAVVSEGLDISAQDSEIETLDASLPALQTFHHALEEVRDCLVASAGQSYLRQVLNQRKNRDELNALSEAVDRAFDSLMIQMKIEASSLIASAEQRNGTLGTVLTMPQIAEPSSSTTTRVGGNSIPPQPQLFFGRESESSSIAHMVCSEKPGRVAILGGPGMGKTTLAVSVLHHPTVLARFASRRFYVPFDAAESQTANCFSTVACAVGIVEPDATQRRKLLAEFLQEDTTLLVLDNFESVWESPESRAGAEELLAFLAAIDGLALIVTLRGAERPQGIAWTRPFLPPLEPLSDDAARQVFYAIADPPAAADADVNALLRHMGNIPLAVVLMSSLAQFESPASLLARWEETKTAMLVRTGGAGAGRGDRLSSLDVSIEVSIRAPRMAQSPGALELLGVLALLPAGIVDSDLQLCAPAYAHALPRPLQSALAHRTPGDSRVRMLAPVRAFVLARYPPSEDTASALYAHYLGMATVLAAAAREGTLAEAYAPAAAEVDNIEALIAYALQHSSDPTLALEAVVALCSNLTLTGLGSAPALLPAALAVSRKMGCDALTGDLLYQWAELAYASLLPGEPEALYREAKQVYERCSNEKGIRSTSVKLLIYLPEQDALEEAERLRQQAAGAGDIPSAALCCTEIANLRARRGDIAGAVAAYEEAVQELTRAGLTTHHLLGYSLCSIADHLSDMGDVQGAKAALQRAVPICEAAGSKTAAADASVLLAVILHQQGAIPAAIERYEQAFKQYRLSNGYYAVKTLAYMAQAHLDAGDEQAAGRTLDTAQQMVHAERDKDLPAQRAMVLQSRAELALWRGDLAEARALALAAAAVAREPDPVIEPEYMLNNQTDIVETMGKIQAAECDRAEAQMSFILAATVWRRFGWSTAVVRVLVLLADTVEDDSAEKLLGAVMLPLLRFGWRPKLGVALLLSARIAQRQGLIGLARQRAKSAREHSEASQSGRTCAALNSLLDELGRKT